MPDKPDAPKPPASLRRRAQRLAATQPAALAVPRSQADTTRLLHELEVHQIELAMQNAELRAARDETDALLAKFTDLYDFAPVGYFTLTATGTIRLANLTGSVLLGIERSRLIGRSLGLLLAAGQRPAFQAFLSRVFAGESQLSLDSALLCNDQPPRFIKISAERSPNGHECSAVVLDVTGRKHAENTLRVSEIRYRRLFEAARDGILVLDPDTCKVTDANPFMTTLLGYPRGELIGKELFEIGLHKDEAASLAMFRKLKRNHQVRYENLPLKSRDGCQQEVEVVANLYQEDGHAVIQCNIRDITARKRNEAAQRRLEALTISNLELQREIDHRKSVEAALHHSEQLQSHALKQAQLQQQHLRDLSHQILHAQEEERKRVSRELHDVIAQTLVGISVHVGGLTEAITDNPATLRAKIADVHRVVDASLDIVHRFARELRPTMLDDLGLIPALQAFMKSFNEDTGVRASLEAFAGIEQATEAVRTVLYRVAQEALSNVARHAKASRAEVSIRRIAGCIRMTITDDGHGFNVNGKSGARNTKRLGIIGMRERVEMIGGSFSVHSAPGHPTTVRVELPVPKITPSHAPQ